MNIKTFSYLKIFITKLLASLERFPEALLCAAAAVTLMIYMNHAGMNMESAARDLLTRVILILALGIPLYLSVRVLLERIHVKKMSIKALAITAAAVFLLPYYIFLLKDFEMASTVRYIATSIALYLSFTFIPYTSMRAGYELYVIKLFISFLITYVYSLILYGGLSAIMFTISQLFSVKITHLYGDIALIVAGVFAPAYFLAGIPTYRSELNEEDYPKVLRVMLLYILMPLLTAYTAILYAYFGKIIITRQWPQGIISHLVLWSSIVVTLVIFFIYPLKNKFKWTRMFILYFPMLLIPTLAMMFISMGIRINAYGITESRYFVILAGIWVTGCMIYFIFTKNPRNFVLPISLALISVLSVTGPWSCFSISKLSQNSRFEKILQKYDMVKDGAMTKPTKDISRPDKEQIGSIISYFRNNYSLKGMKYSTENLSPEQMEEFFGLNPDIPYKQSYFSHDASGSELFQSIKEYEYFIDFSSGQSVSTADSSGLLHVSYSQEDRMLRISKQGKVIYEKDIPYLALKFHKDNKGKNSLASEETRIADGNENIKVLYIFKHISGMEDDATGEADISAVLFYLLIKLAE